ncbi:unnamed protein product [Adineta ricciae]|uniref:Uncharacterized protein n=1 Tax=Adineta ricciae TaxID=249248 RepID=A0A814V842_ADIRI|nr:unnamed protein product [Adineta ricciae]CAF1183314.1 unnamed protein product [Adineta ricciae]
MSNIESVTMLVCWEKQRRSMDVDVNDNLNGIKEKIIQTYGIKGKKDFLEYQIQYFDENFQSFVDLYDGTIDRFRTLLRNLRKLDDSTKKEQIWCLNIVSDETKIISRKSSDPLTVDTNNHPPKNNIDKYTQQATFETDNSIDDSTPSDSMEDTDDTRLTSSPLHREHDHQQQTWNELSSSTHPLQLRFGIDIADRQRRQYESDICKRNSNNKSSLGGVFLQGRNLDNSSSHPTVHFQIPQDKHKLRWYLHFYVLTERDQHGQQYIHASKGIYDNETESQDRFGPILNSNAVNPYVVELNENQIQQEQYEIRLRVCNIHNLSDHKRSKLRKFPELHTRNIYMDSRLLSSCTSNSLKLSCANFHLGCLLISGNRIEDRCISQLTTENKQRKRKKMSE